MRVLHLVQDPGIAPDSEKGAAVHVRAMCHAFRALGATVDAVHARDAASARAQLSAAYTAPVDLLYERYGLGAVEGAAFARQHGTLHVLEVNAPLEDEARRWRGLSSSTLHADAERAAFADASLVLCVSDQVADYARRRGAAPDRVLVRANGVDGEVFRREARSNTLRREWFPGLDRPFVVGFHGRLRPWHGLERVAGAVACAVERGANLAFCGVGKGEFAAVLAAHLPRERWHVAPWCAHSDLARHVATFDALPLGYSPETDCYFSPLKLREAMAAGVVPIVPDLGELPAAVEHGAAGMIYPAGDTAALSLDLTRLASDPALHATLSSRGCASVAGQTWVSIARSVFERFPGVLA